MSIGRPSCSGWWCGEWHRLETGVAGFTLGGGFGWATRRHGHASDNLRSADIVTADGVLRRASETENADLFRRSRRRRQLGLIELLEHVRKVIFVRNDLPTIRSALDELDEFGRWEFGLEEAAFDHSRPEDRASHHQEHEVLLERLRDCYAA